MVSQLRQAWPFVRQFLEAQRQRAGKSHDTGHVERATAQSTFLAAAINLRLKTDRFVASPDPQRANAFWTVDLVRGEAHQVDLELVDVHGNLADRLCGIAVQRHSLLAAHRS